MAWIKLIITWILIPVLWWECVKDPHYNDANNIWKTMPYCLYLKKFKEILGDPTTKKKKCFYSLGDVLGFWLLTICISLCGRSKLVV